MKPIRAGMIGGEIYAAAAPLVQKSKHNNHMEFLAHGMGMVSHEAPRLTDRGPVPYPSEYAKEPLEAGMVVSVETTLMHPARGFIKLEDTVVVTDKGHDAFLLDEPELFAIVRGFLDGAAKARGLKNGS